MAIDCPVGASDTIYRAALDVGRRFARDCADRKPRDIVVYGGGSARYVVWWTKARTVCVRVDVPDAP